jgi:hypothetical protein
MFQVSSIHLQEALLYPFWCILRAIVQIHENHIKIASAVPREDGRLMQETCQDFKTQ